MSNVPVVKGIFSKNGETLTYVLDENGCIFQLGDDCLQVYHRINRETIKTVEEWITSLKIKGFHFQKFKTFLHHVCQGKYALPYTPH